MIIWASKEAETCRLSEGLLAWIAQKNEGDLKGEMKEWIGKTSVWKSICGKTFYTCWDINGNKFWVHVEGINDRKGEYYLLKL